jgi:putative oxidoreductase
MIVNDKIMPSILAIGRIMLASLFVLGGINKIPNYAATLSKMAEVGLEPAQLLLPLVIIVELGAGVAIMIGNRIAIPAALLLVTYTFATNIFFHDFWNMEGEKAALELSLFFKNLSIMGGLLFIAASVSGKLRAEMIAAEA